MKEYAVRVQLWTSVSLSVKAASQEEAVDLVWDMDNEEILANATIVDDGDKDIVYAEKV